jgi:hypothetical protein
MDKRSGCGSNEILGIYIIAGLANRHRIVKERQTPCNIKSNHPYTLVKLPGNTGKKY